MKTLEEGQRNEREVNHIAAAPPLDREMLAKREDELFDRQDAIEFKICREHLRRSMRHWSGLPQEHTDMDNDDIRQRAEQEFARQRREYQCLLRDWDLLFRKG